MVVGLNLLRRDVDALPESPLDESQNFEPVAQIALHPFRSQVMRAQECVPAGIGSAVLTDAGGDFVANLGKPGVNFRLRRVRGLLVLLANLLLDEGTGD